MSTSPSTIQMRRRLTVFDLFSGGQDDLREVIQAATDLLETPDLFGPLYTITHELVVNSLKAVYKKVFFEKFIVEIGMEDINYEEWLMLFKSEIEAHNAENFARLVRDTDQGVDIALSLNSAGLRLLVSNPGAPSEIEQLRIQRSLEVSRSAENLSSILEDMTADENREGASLGIPLIIMSLRKMGADEKSFQVRPRGERTFASFVIGRQVLEKYVHREEMA